MRLVETVRPTSGPGVPSPPEPVAGDLAARVVTDEQYAEIFRFLPQPCWIYDLDDRRVLEVNPEAAEAFARPRAELLNLSMDDLFPSGTTLLDGAVWRGQRPDGSTFELDVTTRTARFAGRPARLVLALDVASRAEAGLEERQERLERIFDHGPLGIVTVGRDLRMLEVNRALARILEFSSDELERMTLSAVIHPDDVEIARGLSEKLFTGEAADVSGEFRCVTRLREQVWLAASASLVRDERGLPLQALWLVQDVSRRKQDELAQRASDKGYRELFERAADIIYTHDLDGSFTAVNHATERLVGYTVDETLRMNVAQLVRPEDVPRMRPPLARSGAETVARTFEVEMIARDGRRVPLEINSRLVYQDGKPVAVQGIARDVSARKRAAEALRQARDKLAEQVRALEQHAREIESLGELGDMLQACLTPEEAYAVFSQVARRLFTAEDGALCILGAAQLVEVAAWWGSAAPVSVFAPDDCWALRRGRLHAVADTSAGMNCRHLGNELPGSYVCVPMMAQGETLGILHLGNLHRREGGAHHQLVVTVAEHVALALSNLKLQGTLRSQSIRDPLTGLFNRRFMEESLERELQRTSRTGGSLGIVMVELETARRLAHDPDPEASVAALRQAAELLQSRARGEDITCRYGTYELTLVLLDSSPEETLGRAEELRGALQKLEFSATPPPSGAGLFLGTAAFPQDGSSAAALLHRACEAVRRDRLTRCAPEGSGA